MPYDCSRTDWPVCPHCGYEDDGAWEYSLGDGMGGEGTADVECPSCDKPYRCERGIDVWYNTSKLDGSPEGGADDAGGG